VLFNSYGFILVFLPVVVAGFFVLARFSYRLAAAWLALASVFFYGWWNPAYVALLALSIGFNYTFGILIVRARASGRAQASRLLLTISVLANLLLLGYYKYANFFLGTVNDLAGSHWSLGEIILPLGISFFTFTQIAFLVDAYRGKAEEYNFIHYGLFVTYFPHLIAGPILHHKEMMPQFERPATYRPTYENFAVGLTIFSIGLLKKVILADGIAPYASPIFTAAALNQPLTLLDAWGGVLAYTLQLYFDFSGYSDMAIGLSRIFGIVLPLNFNSPYKAVNIIDFWRRWHMTLSRFLRDYLYIALGGNRKGTLRKYVNLQLTMLLGGLWHGAGWTFAAWGMLHGVYLIINYAWQALRRALGDDLSHSTRFGRGLARSLTILAVIVGWVFFRSSNFEAATRLLESMVGLHGVALPQALTRVLGPFHEMLSLAGVEFHEGGGSQFILTYLWVGTLACIALFGPNTQEIMRHYRPGLDFQPAPPYPPYARDEPALAMAWHPSWRWSVAIGMAFGCGMLSLTRVSEFLYFQF
jgi:D-alanyl-lipoteichoic acid acyltransferase DltB (MBOAT superfamily)